MFYEGVSTEMPSELINLLLVKETGRPYEEVLLMPRSRVDEILQVIAVRNAMEAKQRRRTNG